jgi:hypothetical protein
MTIAAAASVVIVDALDDEYDDAQRVRGEWEEMPRSSYLEDDAPTIAGIVILRRRCCCCCCCCCRCCCSCKDNRPHWWEEADGTMRGEGDDIDDRTRSIAPPFYLDADVYK